MEGFLMITITDLGETTTILCTTTPNKGTWPGMRNNCSLFISAYPVELMTSTWCALSDNLKPCFVGLVVLFSSLSSGCYNLPFLIQKEPLHKVEWRLSCSWNGPTLSQWGQTTAMESSVPTTGPTAKRTEEEESSCFVGGLLLGELFVCGIS